MILRSFTGLAAMALCLAACSGGKKADNASNAGLDPAAADALEDQIMVDPNLTEQNNRFGARRDGGAMQAGVPDTADSGPAVAAPDKLLPAPAPTNAGGAPGITLGQLAHEQSTRGPKSATAGCDKNFQYSMGWAAKLPAAFPVYADGQVTEAAGNNSEPCRMRLVTFTSRTPVKTLIDYYYTRAVRSGFNAEHQIADGEHILAGAREKGGDAYYLVFAERKGGGSEVDMIVNHGIR